jgi:hypothetical protein
MSAHPPPVPPDQRSKKGNGTDGTAHAVRESSPKQGFKPQDRNLGEQGRQGNAKQNTTNKGYQQDR